MRRNHIAKKLRTGREKCSLARKRNREKDFLFIVPSRPVDTVRTGATCQKAKGFWERVASMFAIQRTEPFI